MLRATYDLIDRLKTWEEERGVVGAVEFQRRCAELDAQYASLGLARDRTGQSVAATPYSPRAVDEHEVLRRRLTHFRARHDALTAERDAHAAEAARLAGDLASLGRLRDETQQALHAERMRAEQAEAECGRAEADATAQRRRAEQAETRLDGLEGEHGALRREHDLLRGGSRLERQTRASMSGNAASSNWRAASTPGCARNTTALQHRHELLQGSLRSFLRCYLPRLRRHLFGQRP